MSHTVKICFVSAGPGDPELITVKGMRLLQQAEVVCYAGSLVPEALLEYCQPETERHNSASMNLEETHAVLKAAHEQGKPCVRLHTGDTAFYSAIGEQIDLLMQDSIPFAVVPGVTAACATAAACGIEFTVPEVTQTTILTRVSGRTPVPEQEAIVRLAAIGCSMAIYLSVSMVEQLTTDLQQGYGTETPVIIGYRVGWPDQKIVETTVGQMSSAIQEHGLTRQVLFLVGDAMRSGYQGRSKLYDKSFAHGFRDAH